MWYVQLSQHCQTERAWHYLVNTQPLHSNPSVLIQILIQGTYNLSTLIQDVLSKWTQRPCLFHVGIRVNIWIKAMICHSYICQCFRVEGLREKAHSVVWELSVLSWNFTAPQRGGKAKAGLQVKDTLIIQCIDQEDSVFRAFLCLSSLFK